MLGPSEDKNEISSDCILRTIALVNIKVLVFFFPTFTLAIVTEKYLKTEKLSLWYEFEF